MKTSKKNTQRYVLYISFHIKYCVSLTLKHVSQNQSHIVVILLRWSDKKRKTCSLYARI